MGYCQTYGRVESPLRQIAANPSLDEEKEQPMIFLISVQKLTNTFSLLIQVPSTKLVFRYHNSS